MGRRVGTIKRFTKPRNVHTKKAKVGYLTTMLDQGKLPRRARRALESMTKPKTRPRNG